MSPPCLESQGCQFDPTFLYLFSFCLVLLLFLSCPFLLLAHSPDLFFPKHSFSERQAPLCGSGVFLSGQEMSTLVGGMCIICWHWYQLLCIYDCIVFLICNCFCNFFYIIFFLSGIETPDQNGQWYYQHLLTLLAIFYKSNSEGTNFRIDRQIVDV